MKDNWFFFFTSFQWVCILFLFLCIGDLYRRKRVTGLTDKESRVVSNTILYPVGMIVTVFPIFIAFAILASGTPMSSYAYQILEILSTQYGTVVGLIFFVYCQEARLRWWELFRYCVSTKNKSRTAASIDINGRLFTSSYDNGVLGNNRLVSDDIDISSRLASFEGEEAFFLSSNRIGEDLATHQLPNNITIAAFDRKPSAVVRGGVDGDGGGTGGVGDWGVPSVQLQF